MSNAELLDRYERGLAGDGKARPLFLKYAGEFLNYAGGNFDRQTIDRYLKYLRDKRNYSDGSVHFIFGIIRTVLGRNNIEWPYRRGESPRIREDKVVHPALSPRKIIEMIEAAKLRGTPDEKAWLALSTTYGLRRVEMQELTKSDVRVKDRVIHIATAKHGRERSHLLPDEIVPYIKDYDFNLMPEFQVFVLWYRLENLIEMNHIDQVGFHSIRRTLNTLLSRELKELVVMSFMRWKKATSSNMPYRYSAVTFVGDEEDSVELMGDVLTEDKQVFAVHPFIQYWR